MSTTTAAAKPKRPKKPATPINVLARIERMLAELSEPDKAKVIGFLKS